jgi:hypothetical protein
MLSSSSSMFLFITLALTPVSYFLLLFLASSEISCNLRVGRGREKGERDGEGEEAKRNEGKERVREGRRGEEGERKGRREGCGGRKRGGERREKGAIRQRHWNKGFGDNKYLQ